MAEYERSDKLPVGQHRRPYDGEKLSTWEKFAKLTGLDLPGSCIVASLRGGRHVSERDLHAARDDSRPSGRLSFGAT